MSTEITLTCHECGSRMTRRSEQVSVWYRDESKEIEVTGWYCVKPECDGTVLIGKDMKPIEETMINMMNKQRES